MVGRKKQPGLVRGAFFYPPAQVVYDGKCEDSWSKHQWFTWPGNQFAPEQQQARFAERLREISAGLDLQLRPGRAGDLHRCGHPNFLGEIEHRDPDALF